MSVNGLLQASNVLSTSATISNLTIPTSLWVPASVITISGSSSYLDITGTGSQTKIFAHSDNQSYMQHQINLVFSTINQITPQVVMSNNGSMSIASNLSIGSNLSVSGTITPAALSMGTNPLYIQNGNAGITYANVAGTGQGMDGPAVYGWQGGVLGYVGNGSNFSPGRNGINGTLYWNYEKVGIGKSNPAYELDVKGSVNVSSNIYASSRIGIGTTSPGYPLHVIGTTVSSVFAGSLAWGYLTSVPQLCSNTSPQVLYSSNTANWSSNALASVASSGNYAWASNALQSNVNNASFSSNIVVGSGLTAYSLTAVDLYVDNTISAQAGISSGGDIATQFNGGGNVGTSGTPWGSVNTLTASLGDASTTSLSNSGVVSLNSADSDKIVFTNVGSSASKISHSGGWQMNYTAGYNTGTTGGHNFYTAYNGGYSNNLQISSQFVNINGTLSNTGNASVGGLLKCTNLRTNNNICMQNTYGSIGVIHYADGATYYHLCTNAGDSAGSFNGLRPYQVNLANGNVSMADSKITMVHSSGNLIVGGVLGVNQQVDSGYGKGIRYWDQNDANWCGYMSQQGAGKSAASNTASSSLDGRTSHHIRMRVGSGASQGFIWENANETCLMSLTADTGSLYVRSLIQTSNITVGQTLNSVTHSNSGNFYNGGTGTFGGQLTLSNGLVMKANNWITSVPDNANRVYFAQSADTTFSSPNGQYNFYNNLGNTSVQITSNLGINYPQSDPGFMINCSYGTKPSLDIYGFGQMSGGVVRSVISGSYSAASFRVCKPFNTSYTSWTDFVTVGRVSTARLLGMCGNHG
jgi:hypothetical protein